MLKDLKAELEAQSNGKDSFFEGFSDNSKLTIILGAPHHGSKKF